MIRPRRDARAIVPGPRGFAILRLVTTESFLCPFLAAVPVGHRVALEYHEYDAGVIGRKMEIDRRWFVVVDLDTGIRWGSKYTWTAEIAPNAERKLKERYEGTVRGCDVSSHMGSQFHDVWTRLTVELDRKIDL